MYSINTLVSAGMYFAFQKSIFFGKKSPVLYLYLYEIMQPPPKPRFSDILQPCLLCGNCLLRQGKY